MLPFIIAFAAIIIGILAILIIATDDRIQDPYSSILIFVIIGIMAYIAKHFYF